MPAHHSKRYVSCGENIPPVHLNAKLLALNNSRRKVSRTHGAPNAKHAIERSLKRRDIASTTTTTSPSRASSPTAVSHHKASSTSAKPRARRAVRLNVTPLPKSVVAPSDQRVDPTEPVSVPRSSSSVQQHQHQPPQPISMNFPRQLVKPPFKEVATEAIASVDPELVDTDKIFLRDSLELHGPALFHSLSSVKARPAKDRLPTEQVVTITDPTAILPTHMLAIFGKDPLPTSSSSSSTTAPEAGPSKPRKVTLFPVHSLVLASHCANLPPFPPTIPLQSTSRVENQEITLPVWPLCLPSPISYPALSTYLYTRRTELLFRAMLPAVPESLSSSSSFSSSESQQPLDRDWSQTRSFGRSLAQRFTSNLLLKHTLLVHGLWQNMCALGIHDAGLWDAVDVMWEVLLVALAVASGSPDAVDELDRQVEEEEERRRERQEKMEWVGEERGMERGRRVEV